MTLSEALAAATRIVECYPNPGVKISSSYLGAIAAALQSYPRQVALKCPAEIVGMCEYLPSVAHIIKYCEGKTTPLYVHHERERRIDKQLADHNRPPDDAAARARVIKGFAELKELLGGSIQRMPIPPNPQETIKAREKAEKLVAEDWGEESAPTIGGIPVSRELVESMKRPANWLDE
jgi:hypothetical protein